MNQKQYFEIKDRIVKVLQKELNEDEKKEFEAWLRKSKKNRDLYETIRSQMKTHDDLKAFDTEYIDEAYRRFMQSKGLSCTPSGKNWRRVIMRYAAVLLLPLLTTGLFYVLKNNSSQSESMIKESDHHASNVPTLELSDGSSLLLDDQHREVVEQNGTAIERQTDGSLIYRSKENNEEKLIFNKLNVPCKCDYQFTLSDGTKVWVNANSEVRYPVLFGKDERIVYATGEVYFEVAKDVNRPFYVQLNGVKLEVLGTSFNTNSYEEHRMIDITLTEGSVKAYIGDSKVLLTPEHQLRVDKSSQEYEIRKVDPFIYSAWRSGHFIFRNTTLNDIAFVFKRWYGVEFVFLNESRKEITYTGIVNKEDDIEVFLKRVQKISPITYQHQNDIIYIR